MQSKAATVDEYLQTVEPERLPALLKLRQLCLDSLKGYTESMQYGMPYYTGVDAHHVAFNSQKNYISLYGIRQEVRDRHQSYLNDAGKGCIRFRRPEQIDFAVVEEMLKESASPL